MSMNKLEIKHVIVPTGYETDVFHIDGKPLYEYMEEWLKDSCELYESLSPLPDLDIPWTDEFDWEGEALFMRYILEQQNAITPILLCSECFDFECTVIVADVVKHDDVVQWKRVGKINHANESFEEEKRSGILLTEAYTKEDWEKYGDNIALEKVDSTAWSEWISENWTEELYRRMKNYKCPYFQDENNVEWFADCNFEFDRKEYDAIVEHCYAKSKDQFS